jgi:hypothetical protein
MSFGVGFETIGNATLILHDGRPLLATDPWITGPAYFGSWGLSHEIPAEHMEAIRNCEYVWISHGHPDHLSGDSLKLLANKKVLVPDHVGARVYNDLREQGFAVRILKDREWFELSPRVRVLCIADYNQDGVLLCDVNGRLVLNLNDASDRGWGGFVRKLTRGYRRSFLLNLANFGDADMLNLWNENGARLPLPPRTPLGLTVSHRAICWGATCVIPFSAMHRYQRADSVWASCQAATDEDYANGFQHDKVELLPAYVRYDCDTDEPSALHPKPNDGPPIDPKEFGDDWNEPLTREDKALVRQYFGAIEHLATKMGFLRFVVGGEETIVRLNDRHFDRGLTFEVPRGSLTTALKYEIFDDLLIGNFMRVTLHGKWGPGGLYPDFSPYVAKYADNGRAKTLAELREYHRKYYQRDPLGYLRHRFDADFLLPLQTATSSLLRSRLGANSTVFRTAKKAYWYLRTAGKVRPPPAAVER